MFAESFSCCRKWWTKSVFFTFPSFLTKKSRTEARDIPSLVDMVKLFEARKDYFASVIINTDECQISITFSAIVTFACRRVYWDLTILLVASRVYSRDTFDLEKLGVPFRRGWLFFSEFQSSKHQRGEDLFTLTHTGQENPCARRVLHGWRFSPTYFPVPSGKSWSRFKWNIYTIIIPLASFIAAQLWHVFLTDKGSAWPWVRNSTKTVRIRKLEPCFIGAFW